MDLAASVVAAQPPAETRGPGAAAAPWPLPPALAKRCRVGEIVAHTGLTRQTLHNHARGGLIHPAGRAPGGHRLDDEAVFARLARIAALKPGASLGEIRRRLDADGGRSAAGLDRASPAASADRSAGGDGGRG